LNKIPNIFGNVIVIVFRSSFNLPCSTYVTQLNNMSCGNLICPGPVAVLANGEHLSVQGLQNGRGQNYNITLSVVEEVRCSLSSLNEKLEDNTGRILSKKIL